MNDEEKIAFFKMHLADFLLSIENPDEFTVYNVAENLEHHVQDGEGRKAWATLKKTPLLIDDYLVNQLKCADRLPDRKSTKSGTRLCLNPKGWEIDKELRTNKK